MPTVGAGSSQREDSPVHRHPPPYAQIAPMKDPTVFVAPRRAASLSGLRTRLWRPMVFITARRVVICPRLPVDARMGVNDGRCGNPPNDLPAMPTVGAGSSRFSRRFPRPPSPAAPSHFVTEACEQTAKMVPTPRGHSPAGYSPSGGHPLRYLRGVEAGMPPPRSINQSQ